MVGMWFCTINDCTTFLEEYIPDGQFQWFIYIAAYLQFVTGDTVIPRKSQLDEMHSFKASNTKEQPIFIYSLKTDILPILVRLSKGKESTTTLTATRTPELWNAHDGVRGVYPRAYKYLQDQCLKL